MSEFRRRLMMGMMGGGGNEGIPSQNGVYIYDRKGNYHLASEFDTSLSSIAIGVVLISNTIKCGILGDSSTPVQWCPSSQYEIVSGVANVSDMEAAQVEMAGKSNTDSIINRYGVNTDTSAGFIVSQIDSTLGLDLYLPSSGQMFEIYKHINEINEAFSKFASSASIKTNTTYWTSTQTGSNFACTMTSSGISADVKDTRLPSIVFFELH